VPAEREDYLDEIGRLITQTIHRYVHGAARIEHIVTGPMQTSE
jgi:hypothetical protein